jgi:acyl carrier protein
LPVSVVRPIERELAELIVSTLNLEISVADISPTALLFDATSNDHEAGHAGGPAPQQGLGLDSIDALELALAISQRYGFQLKSDDERNHQIFASLRSLAAHIEKHRTR